MERSHDVVAKVAKKHRDAVCKRSGKYKKAPRGCAGPGSFGIGFEVIATLAF